MVGSDEGESSGQFANTMRPAQSRAARALLDWSAADLASRSGLDEGLVHDFETGAVEVPSGRVEALRSTLMANGVIFSQDAGAGVSLRSAGIDEGTQPGDLTTENDR